MNSENEISLSLARREFMKTGLLASFSLPTLLNYSALAGPIPKVTAKHKTLVIIQLDGGNDGLNTVVPWGNSRYYRARENIAIKEADVLKFTGVKAAEGLGVHPQMEYFTELFQEGKLAVINNVGYAQPNRSHFKSGAIWESGLDGAAMASEDQIRNSSGWIGRYFDKHCGGESNLVGAYYGDSPLAMRGQAFTGTSISDLQSQPFGFMKLGEDMALHPAFRKMQEAAKNADESSGEKLSFVRNVAAETQTSTDQMRKFLADVKQRGGDFPRTKLGKQLGMISELIINGGDTRVYQARIGGFDTHSGQAAKHARLWKEINDALRAFIGRMKSTGLDNDVAVMTYSEFGRQLKENGTGGTDHGAAAPVFIIGGGVKGAIYGKPPTLKGDQVNNYGGLAYEIDFRSVYKSILEEYLKVDTIGIISDKYPALKLF
jgi:uncharacterized protein (DUF1501 family)